MGLVRKLGGGALVAASALAGNALGSTLRATTTGETQHQLGLVHTTNDGQTVLGLNIALTNFLPALLLAVLAGKPRVLYAFISGAVISALVGDGYERALVDWLRDRARGYSESRLAI